MKLTREDCNSKAHCEVCGSEVCTAQHFEHCVTPGACETSNGKWLCCYECWELYAKL